MMIITLNTQHALPLLAIPIILLLFFRPAVATSILSPPRDIGLQSKFIREICPGFPDQFIEVLPGEIEYIPIRPNCGYKAELLIRSVDPLAMNLLLFLQWPFFVFAVTTRGGEYKSINLECKGRSAYSGKFSDLRVITNQLFQASIEICVGNGGVKETSMTSIISESHPKAVLQIILTSSRPGLGLIELPFRVQFSDLPQLNEQEVRNSAENNLLLNSPQPFGAAEINDDKPQMKNSQSILAAQFNDDDNQQQTKDTLEIEGAVEALLKMKSASLDQSEETLDLSSGQSFTTISSPPPKRKQLRSEVSSMPKRKRLNSVPLNPTDNGPFNDLPARFKIKQIHDGQEKIEALLEIERNLQEDGRPLSRNARQFVIAVLQPALKCLRTHFDGDTEKFGQKWRNFPMYQFREQCCSGDEIECQILRRNV